MLIFPTYENRRTLAIGNPVETSHTSFMEEGYDQASPHPMYSVAYDDQASPHLVYGEACVDLP
jgi:hypothetical protein